MPIKGLDLKPCPFCGGEADAISITVVNSQISNLKIHCPRCGTDFELHERSTRLYANNDPITLDYVSPVDKWNSRVEVKEE